MKQTATLLAILLCFTLTTQAQQATLPYFDDFEYGAWGWTPYVTTPCGTNWELGTPSSGFTIGAYSGVNCWDVNLNSAYSNDATCFLSSPIFDFSMVATAHISFWTRYRTEYLWDYLSVQYSIDKGDTWEYMPFPNLIDPHGHTDKWVMSDLHVNNFYGQSAVQFRFVFVSDNTVSYDGYSIDDFRIDIDALGTPELDSDVFSMYPNPSKGELNLRFTDNVNTGGLVTIYDVTGKTVITKELSHLTGNFMQISQLNSGTYSVVYNDNEVVKVKKLVVVE